MAAARVAAVTRRRYPDLAVPFHSRWRHFSAGGIDRAALVAPAAGSAERARAGVDLAIVSVLLDAGAGAGWRYREAETGQVLSRSEGLAVASLRAMQAGLFSGRSGRSVARRCRSAGADRAGALGRRLPARCGQRACRARRLAPRCCAGWARSCVADPARFGTPARPGHLYDYWRANGGPLGAAEILRNLLVALGPIWPGRISLDGVPLGDCGRHPAVPGDGLVPFHKLSQWLAYSLVEPLAAGGH